MICLCCGRKITAETDSVEYQYGWHRNCIRRFFGTDTFPDIDLSERALKRLVDQNVNKGLTVPGVQKKLSLHLDVSSGARLTLVIIRPVTFLSHGRKSMKTCLSTNRWQCIWQISPE